jgi:uncharacterized repeat protein (TIGR03803 family)
VALHQSGNRQRSHSAQETGVKNLKQHSNSSLRSSSRKTVFALALLCGLTMTATPSAEAQTFTVVHSFTGSEGSAPYSGLTIDRAGNFYGTTFGGGTQNLGVVYRLYRIGGNWILSNLYSFEGPNAGDGSQPQARVVFGPDGALYGTTSQGGQFANCNFTQSGCGTVFRITPPAGVCPTAMCSWIETPIHSFQASDGQLPGGGDLIFDATGGLWGTT